MRKNTSILRYQQTPGKPHKALSHAPLAKLKRLLLPAYNFIPETIACLLFFTVVSAMAADLRARGSPQINLLEEFRPRQQPRKSGSRCRPWLARDCPGSA